MTKPEFKRRVKALGLDPIQATVLFGFSHSTRFYSNSENVSTARESFLATFEQEKADGKLKHRLAANAEAIDVMREKRNSALRKWRKQKGK